MENQEFRPDIRMGKLLLVEGMDEVNFFACLLSHMAMLDVQVIQLAGKDHFHRRFPLILNSKHFHQVRAYAILRDADQDPDNAFKSVAHLLRKYGQPTPAQAGGIQDASGLRTGIYILPGDRQSGMLENLVLEAAAIPEARECVEIFMGCVTRLPVELQPHNKAKSKAKAYLAAMQEDVPSVGIASQKGYWNLDHPTLSPLKQFLHEVFSP
ncbi:MAG: hypothetical protein HQL55_06585 [Magnetococcales bacterium]|nr:hypothetical protein [Magnetococcales bacterium]